MKLSRQVRLYPNKTMKRVLDSLCDYRRYCWNQAIACWNAQYEARSIGLPEDLRNKLRNKTETLTKEERELANQYPRPSHYSVRNELVANKEDWQYEFSSRVLQQAVKDLATAWELFFNNRDTAGKPTFKTRKATKQGFKTDTARIHNGQLLLDLTTIVKVFQSIGIFVSQQPRQKNNHYHIFCEFKDAKHPTGGITK